MGRGDSRRERPREKGYEKVSVLMLTFEFTDLDLGDETRRVEKVFKGLGYKITPCNIPMKNPFDNIKGKVLSFLGKASKETLLIIYYHGHGGPLPDGKYGFTSHNYPKSVRQLWGALSEVWGQTTQSGAMNHLRDIESKHQPIASICWQDIVNHILDANGDTLVILDCCDAGLASVTSMNRGHGKRENQIRHSQANDQAPVSRDNKRGEKEETSHKDKTKETSHKDKKDETTPNNKKDKTAPNDKKDETDPKDKKDETVEDKNLIPRKELIGACSWNNATYNDMSSAMCEALNDHFRDVDPSSPASISASHLASDMNDILGEKFLERGGVPQTVHYLLRHPSSKRDGTIAGKILLPKLSPSARQS